MQKKENKHSLKSENQHSKENKKFWGRIGYAILLSIGIVLVLSQLFDQSPILASPWFLAIVLASSYLIVHFFFRYRIKNLWKKRDNVHNLEYYRTRKEQLENETEKPLLKSIVWVTVYSGLDYPKAELMNALLIENNIKTHLGNRHAATIMPNIGGIEFQLMVKKEDLDLVKTILKKHDLI
ncbi:MAG: hypothetical protein ACI86H_002430 [bacterium]|jgi:hypothetical protein